MITAKFMEIDDTLAQYFLTYNRRPEHGVRGTNRRLSLRTVKNYAGSMDRGEWRETHQGIAFVGRLDDEGATMADGQHRLEALLLANQWRRARGEKPITIKLMVSEGLTEEDAVALDINRRRSPADFLSQRGEKDTNLLGSIIKLCYLYENVPYGTDAWYGFRITPTLQDNFLETKPRVREAVAAGKHLWPLLNRTAAGAGWFLAIDSGVEEDSVKEFVEGLVRGANLAEDSAILIFRNLMINSEKQHRLWTTPEQLALYIKAMNKWLDDVPVKQLGFKKGESFPRFTD